MVTTYNQLEFDFEAESDEYKELDFSDEPTPRTKKVRVCDKCGSKLEADEKDICNDCLDANATYF